MLQNFGDLEFDLSRSPKVKCEHAIRFLIYDFLLMFNSNTGPNKARYKASITQGLTRRDTRLQNLGDLEFDLSRSLKVKSNGAVGCSIYDFLLVSNTGSNCMSKTHRLRVIATQKFFPYLLSLGPNFDPAHALKIAKIMY